MRHSDTSKLSLRTLFADAFAGGLTATVLYAEYIGIGALLGAALPGRASFALGGLMVIGAVVVSSVFALAVRQPLVSGPRAASLAVLIVGMKFAAEQSQAVEGRFVIAMAALATMLVVGAATLLLGLVPSVQRFVMNSHVSLRKGFIFATAVGIVVALGAAQLDGCMRVSPLLTTAIASISVGAALAWAHVCRLPNAARPWQKKLAPLSMVVGVCIATMGYYTFIAQSVRSGLCGTLGTAGLQFTQLKELLVGPSTFILATTYMPWWVWLVLIVIGVLQGGVLLLESLTAMRDSNDDTDSSTWAAHVKLRAVVNLVCAPLGFANSSVSGARTKVLQESNVKTRLGVIFHGLSLLAILFFCSTWIAKLPNLAAAVALTLVATQMIDDETRNAVWREGYEPTASTTSVGVTWIFWCVLGASVMAGSVLRYFDYGFGGGPLIALVVGAIAMAAFASRPASKPTEAV